MARARRPEGITEDEHRGLHGELEEAGAVGGAVGGGRGVPGPDRRPSGGRAGARFATRFLGYDIETRTCGSRPPAPCSTGPSGRSAR
jgi:hypothetical protein